MYRRILVATGDQPWCSAAVSHGIALAAHTGAALHFLHVLTLPIITGTPDTSPGASLVVESLEDQGKDILAWVATAAEQADVPYSTTMRWGRIVDTILSTAEAEDCDLIVVGTPARRLWHPLLRGDIALRTARYAQQPVMVVKQPLLYPNEGIRWSHALVVTDGSPSTEGTMAYALTLAQAEDLDVSLLHVKAAWLPGKAEQATVWTKETGTLVAAHAAAAGIRSDVQVALQHPVPTILQTAADSQCDVIILGMHRGSYWQRFWAQHYTRAVIVQAACPVLLVPATPMLAVPVED